MRIAFFTPLNPVRSGISDYSEELLPFLQALVDVDVIVDSYEPAAQESLSGIRVRSVEQYRAAKKDYDIAVFQIGNSFDHHGYMIPVMRDTPGMLVLHDYCLQYLMLGVTLRQGDWQGLRETLRPVYKEETPKLMRELLWHRTDPNRVTFADPLIRGSLGTIVHSQYARNEVLRDCPGANVRVIPMGVPPDSANGAAEALKRKYGFNESDFVIASISTQSYTKRLSLVVDAVERILPRAGNIRLLIVGGSTLPEHLRNRIHGPLGQFVRTTGWLPADQYRDYIRLSDVVVDLRYPSGAETSASLSRALAAGKPAILSAQGSFLEMPETLCLRIPVVEEETRLLGEAILLLHAEPLRLKAMGAAALDYASHHLSLDAAAKEYVRFAQEIIQSGIAVRPGSSSPQENSAITRQLVSQTYRLSRALYLQRLYGWRGLSGRVRREVSKAWRTKERAR